MQKPQTIKDCIRIGAEWLQRRKVDEALVVVELLAARLCKCGRLELHRCGEQVPQQRFLDAMGRGLRRIAAGEPVQYVLGEWDFRELTLKVDARALIPRPETEQLVELVLKSPRVQELQKPLVVDVGTGSGCIILSLASVMPDGVFVGLDISEQALELARENAVLNKLDSHVYFAQCDGCGEFDPGSVDLLVSNPPYIPSAVVDKLDVRIREHEPRLALDGGADGLNCYRDLLFDAVMVVKSGGSVFFEIGDDQGAAVSAMLEEFGFLDVRVHQDLAGKDRFVTAVQG